MERFFSEQNLEHYNRLAGGGLTAAERRKIFALLSEDVKRRESMRSAHQTDGRIAAEQKMSRED